jgi:hypothetical protein
MDETGRDSTPSWWPAVGGIVAGIVAGVVLMTAIGGDESTPATSTGPTATSSTVGVVAVAPDYPEGYVELAPGVAARPEEIIVDDNLVTVVFTSVVARGADAAATSWPRGGSWLLDTSSGVTLQSSRVVFGAHGPGVFTVQFPAANIGPTEFDEARLLERWDTEQFTGATSMPFVGEPFESPELISIAVSQDITLLLPALRLGRFSGAAEWQISGAAFGGTVNVIPVLLDGDDEEVGSYAAFRQVRDPSHEGVLDLNWQRDFPDDQEGAVTVRLEYAVDVIELVTTDVEVPLAGIPVDR